MKRLLLGAAIMLTGVCAQAQLKVYENGNVAIQTEGTPVNKFTIGYAGNDKFDYSMSGANSGLYVRRIGTPTVSFNWWRVIEAECGEIVSGNFNIGVKGSIIPAEPAGSGRGYGVFGQARNTTSGYNYGVFGTLLGEQNGAGVYGTVNADNGIDTGGRYAGYFNGDVYITGNLYGTILTESASTLSANTPVALTASVTDEESTADKLSQLSPIQFNLGNAVALASTEGLEEDTAEVATLSATEIQALEKSHYGLVATELQAIYPDLVYENQKGDLCINYIEMIPLLVQSIKELNTRLAIQENGGSTTMSYTRSTGNATSVEESTSTSIPVLKQNNPNPFTESTVIACTLPETVQTANIYIYDMNGTQIQQIPLTERGETSVTVSGGQLSAGMYLYSLIADGKVIDTKRMILTK